MKSIQFIFLILIILWSSLSAQEKHKISINEKGFELQLDDKHYNFSEKQINQFRILDYYDYTDESLSGYFKLPYQELLLAIPPESKANVYIKSSAENKYVNIIPALNPAVDVINDSTTVLRELDYSERKIGEHNPTPIEVKGYLWLRDFYCIHLKIHTHQYDEKNNSLTELSNIILQVDIEPKTIPLINSPLISKSEFDDNLKLIIANASIAEQFRGSPKLLYNDTTGNWINYNANYIKIGVASDGIFRISKSDFDNWGVPTAGINPLKFQLFESGIEKPIHVAGEIDMSFDAGDYIEFYGTKNYSKISPRIINPNNQPYINYLDKYTDTTMYFLTWNTTNGLRASVSNMYQPSVTDSIDYFTSITHYEENSMDALFYTFHSDIVESQFPFWDTGKGWYWRWLATWSGQVNHSFSASDVVTNKTARFFGKLSSWSSNRSTNSHITKLLLNDIKIDSQMTNRYQRVLLNGTISSNSLVNGNNSLKITYNEASGAGDGAMLLDWLEVEYPKKLKLTGSSLYFSFTDLSGTSLKKIKIENLLSSNYQLYKIKPSFQKILAFSIANGNLYFTDTLSNGDAYFLVQTGIFITPKFYKYKTFSNLRSQNTQTDYIGILHPVFQSSVNNYVNYISSNFSVSTSLFSVEDIYDEFGFGYPTPESIREFCILKFQNAPMPKPLYLVLFGDANYDYKKYRFATQGIVGGGNFVPSFGYPVSDQFYVIWDSTGFRQPQMHVGRIPLNFNSEMDYYKSKVQNNIEKPFDDWNKRYLFFSGGRANYPSEIALYKSVNDSVINNFIIPPPLSGRYFHFYKTVNPFSDFGPYPPSVVTEAIDAGGVFISYIGHSGTATWDNSIVNVKQLKNKVNRNPVISDFGCSTNKFAEPDIVSFGEKFVIDPDGQALGYIGNSALGFVSTAIKGPGDFYKHVIRDSMFTIGKAHLSAKYLMFQQLGSSNVVNQFSFANTIMGDPIVKMRIPTRPNLSIKQNDIILNTNSINDAMDSVEAKIILNNYGTVVPQSYKYSVVHQYQNSTIKQIEVTRGLQSFKDTITYWFNVKDKPGAHSIVVNLDTENSLNEIYENDNMVSVPFNVSSSSLRDILINKVENPMLDSLILLSPADKSERRLSIYTQLSNNELFNNPIQTTKLIDTFYTKISLNTPPTFERSWVRYKLENSNFWSEPISYSKLPGWKYFVSDDYSWRKQNLNKLRIVDSKIQLTLDTIDISVVSAGDYFGKYCLISKNGINILTNTFFQGIGIVVFDEKTLKVDTTAWYELFNNIPAQNACIQFINSIPPNKLVALGVATDAKNNPSTALNNAIASLGGYKFAQLQYKAPYVLLGKKGADSTQVKEFIKNPFEGPITFDTSIVVVSPSGILTSTQIGPSSQWRKMRISQIIQNNAKIRYRPLAIKRDETVDTLSYLNLTNNEADLSNISASIYPYIKIQSELQPDSFSISPQISKLEVDYKGVAEIGTNYQAVAFNKDTLEQGQKGRISFYVINAGETAANNFKVTVDVIRPDNSFENVLDQQVALLTPGEKKLFAAGFITDFEAGNRFYEIKIDRDNQVFEYYKDNNVFSIPFYIKRDTSRPIINITFDDKEIIDGDYVSPTPRIRMELSDPSLLPIYDTSSLYILLNDKPVYFAENNSSLSHTFNPENPKMVVEYKPKLNEGEHTLKVFANDGFGNLADSAGLEKRFIVSNEMKMLDIYNYPNPIKSNTHFTFTVTQVPDKIKILVYSVAGRLVKEITRSKNELTSNFNKIFWDTRDEDGDLLGNGTYFYKVIMEAGDKTESSTHKLAIVR